MFTKCPVCGTSNQVTCLNKGKKVLATASAFIVGAAAKLITPNGSPSSMKETYKNICPEGEYYCKRCKHYFKVSTF